MKTIQKIITFSCLMAVSFVASADLNCRSGRLLNVSGYTLTNSLSAEIQSGETHLVLSDASGVVYDKHCGIIGKIVKTSATGLTTWLDHNLVCSSKDGFNSNGDKADFVGGGYPVIAVHEAVTKVKNAKGFFEDMQAEIFADGTLNLATGVNSFELSGQVCFKDND
jgi:hypothetical protein